MIKKFLIIVVKFQKKNNVNKNNFVIKMNKIKKLKF